MPGHRFEIGCGDGHEIARYMSTLKGKRLRPALALLGAKATETWDDRIIEGAAAVEMIHAATMIHDDVVDSATMRRGKSSVNSVWSGQVAVLMGDFLLARALGMLVDLGNLNALGAVARATERLSQGEIFEIQIGRETDTSLASYFAMVGDKTASLIAAACQLGPTLRGHRRLPPKRWASTAKPWGWPFRSLTMFSILPGMRRLWESRSATTCRRARSPCLS